MSWFKRIQEGITTQTKEKLDVPKGVWHQCKRCKKPSLTKEHLANLCVCPLCDHHHRIGSEIYFNLLFDESHYTKLFTNLRSKDILGFEDLKTYPKRLENSKRKTGLEEAMQIALGQLQGHDLVIGAMDFNFIGGSMGSVVGQKIANAIDYAIAHRIPLLLIAKSGGARMMEAAFSLMQMAKTAAKLSQLAKAQVPYISLLTDPTTGGVSASFAMLGDINLAEPNALIGFAGPRVIKETLKKKELPEGFQSAEFVLKHGFLDRIVHRKDLKQTIGDLLFLLKN